MSGQSPEKIAEKIVIIGAGQAGVAAASGLRAAGFTGSIDMFGNENVAPYQRPPLSKAYLLGEIGLDRVIIKPESALEADGIKFHKNSPVKKIDRQIGAIELEDRRLFPFDAAIIATGSHVRHLPVEGANHPSVHYLRGLADVETLAPFMRVGVRMVVIGGGYIGLEVAAVARKKGMNVIVVEAMARLLARVTTPEVSEYFADLHRSNGVDVRLGNGVMAISDGKDGTANVHLDSGEAIVADVILVGIGIIPNIGLASDADLEIDNGIATDEHSCTSDRRIFAIGDCASRPSPFYAHKRVRLESVHNALEQAKLAVAAILGQNTPKLEPPWFWSDQYDVKLQTAGLAEGALRTIIRGDRSAGKFAAFHMAEDNRLLAADCVNSASEFMVAKMLIAQGARVSPTRLANMDISMKEIMNQPL